MKKITKKLLALTVAGALATSMGALVACGGDNNGDNNDGANGTGIEYVFEAEYTDLTGLKGLGSSGSPSGKNLISDSDAASNGSYVSQLGEESPITFIITSDRAATATLKGVFGSNEIPSVTWAPEEFAIEVNGTAITYTSFKTEKGASDIQNFKLRTLGTINLKEGTNTIVFKPHDNKHLNGMTSGPSIDCIKLTTEAKLTWNPLESNLD